MLSVGEEATIFDASHLHLHSDRVKLEEGLEFQYLCRGKILMTKTYMPKK
jgi:hypothetical protein